MRSRFSAFRWTAALAVMVILALNGAGLLTMRSQLGDLSSTKRKGPIWTANQLEFELLRFTNALALFTAKDPDVDADEVRFRFDILWSRHAVAKISDLGEPAADESPEVSVIVDLGAALVENESRLAALTDEDTAAAKVLLTNFQVFAEPLHSYTLVVKEEQAVLDREAREDIWYLSQLTAAFGGALGVGSILLAALFFADSRLHRKISQENLRLLNRANAAYQARIEFLSTVSHELRTPLTSIKGVLCLFDAGALGKLSDKAAKMARIAYINSDRLEKLIDDILDSVKSEKGEWNFHYAPTDLAEAAKNAINAIGTYQVDRKIRFVNLAGDVSIHADRIRIEQVLNNLISNALKFSEKDTEVIVRLETLGDIARLSVQDFGIGISDEFKPSVFERFTQADSSDRRMAGGTGLGLNITQRIVEAHGGSIYFDSELGAGSTFYVEFPLTLQDKQIPQESIAA